MVRHTKGRQKIEMKRMPNAKNLQVTFSKRRNGVFKKASELSILCGVEILIIVFSPGKKVFTFGNPTVESVLDRYLNKNPPPLSGILQFERTCRRFDIGNLNSHLTQVVNESESEKKRVDDLRNMRLASQEELWEKPIEEHSVEELQHFRRLLEELRENIIAQQTHAQEL